PDAVTTSAASTLSIVIPSFRVRYPIPPASVIPPMPTDPVSPTPGGRRHPPNPARPGVAEPGPPPGRPRGCRVRPCGQPSLSPRGAAVHVDVDRMHVPQIEHDTVLDCAVACTAVTAAAHGQRNPAVASERDDAGDIDGIGRPDDDRRTYVETTEENRAGLIVAGILRRDDAATDGGTKSGDRIHGRRWHCRRSYLEKSALAASRTGPCQIDTPRGGEANLRRALALLVAARINLAADFSCQLI